MRRLITLSMCLCMLLGSLPVYASNSTSNVVLDTYNGIDSDEVKENTVQTDAAIQSTFTVMIPKKIVLNSETQSADYNVSVTGDISGNERIEVAPDTTVTFSQEGKDDVIATIKQNKTKFTFADISANTSTTGSITAEDLTAGQWVGLFNFYINLEEITTILEAGAYDANGIMVASWDELVGIYNLDIEYDYDTSNYDINPSSMYSVLNNNNIFNNVTSIVIGNSVARIGNSSFQGCERLKKVVIPEGVTYIGAHAFATCTNLVDISFPSTLNDLSDESSVFLGTAWIEEQRTKNKFVIINNMLVDAKICSGDVVIPTGITSIEPNCFSNSVVTSVVIPDGVVSIGLGAFYKCTSLTSVEIPDSVISIKQQSFADCSNLESVTIPDGVAEIEYRAFYNVPHIYYYGSAEDIYGNNWGALSIN